MKNITLILLLCGNAFASESIRIYPAPAITKKAADARYVNVAGDVMSGPLQTSSLTVTGAGSFGGTLTVPNFVMSGTASGDYADHTGFAADTQIYSFISEMDAPLTSGVEISNILGRIRWKDSGNSNAILNGVEGVCSSTTTDESITCRGGSFRTYTATGGTLRSSFGIDISARAGIPGASDIIAEGPGTAFVGARIYMAPGFTPATIANVNNFHGLWIYNEHATNAVTNGITLSDAGGGFTQDINLQHGETISNAVDGTVSIGGNAAVTGNAFSVGTTTMVVSQGMVSIGTTTMSSSLNIADGKLYLSGNNVSHGMTSLAPNAVFAGFGIGSANFGGINIDGLTDEDSNPLVITGVFGTTNPTDTIPAILLSGARKNGVTKTTMDNLETVLQVKNNATTLTTILGSGNVGINTTAPTANLHIQNASQTPDSNYALKVSSANGNLHFGIHSDGHICVGGQTTTLGTCLNGALSATSKDTAGKVTFSGANSSCAIVFAKPYDEPAVCVLTGAVATAGEGAIISTESASGFTFVPNTGAWDVADAVNYFCVAPHN